MYIGVPGLCLFTVITITIIHQPKQLDGDNLVDSCILNRKKKDFLKFSDKTKNRIFQPIKIIFS
jgi:hypothetical protein